MTCVRIPGGNLLASDPSSKVCPTKILTPYIGGLPMRELVKFDELGMNNAGIMLPSLYKLL